MPFFSHFGTFRREKNVIDSSGANGENETFDIGLGMMPVNEFHSFFKAASS